MSKRKNTSVGDSAQPKRPRLDSRENQGPSHRHIPQPIPSQTVNSGQSITVEANAPQLHKATIKTTSNPSCTKEVIHKLAPPRPFPTVPSSTSASGPKSAHTEGKNLICITRRTSLAAYLARCKKILTDEGYQILHLHAMGAAIPHLLTLAVSLPPILPFAQNEVKVEVRTGTIEVMDEIMPKDDDEDIGFRTRGKGGTSVVIRIRDGKDPSIVQKQQHIKKAEGKKPEVLVIQEQDQEDEMYEDEDEAEDEVEVEN